MKALTRSLLTEMKQISENNPLFSEEMRLYMVNIDHPGKIADFVTSILNIDRYEQQKILEMPDVQARMEHVLVFIKKEQELLKIQKKIQDQLNEKISKSQREYFLKEELKAIKGELGMAVDAKSSEYRRLKEAVEKLGFEGDAKEPVDKELEKFSLMDANSPSSSSRATTSTPSSPCPGRRRRSPGSTSTSRKRFSRRTTTGWRTSRSASSNTWRCAS